MRVLRVTRTMDATQGGVVEAVHQAALVFNSDEWQMDVVCLDEPNAEYFVDYRVYALGKGKTAYGFHFGLLKWIWLNARKYDVVVFDGLWQFHLVSAFLLKILNVKFFIFTHGMLDPYFNKHKLKYVKKLPFWFLVERNILAMATSTIFTCHEESKLAAQSFPLYKTRAAIATLGVKNPNCCNEQSSELILSKFPELRGKRVIFFLSRIDEKKGIDLVIEAMGRQKHLPSDVVLAIAGPDSKNLKAELQELVQRLKLNRKIFWLGMLKGGEKWSAFNLADVFILPSHQENFGIVVAEALAMSTPVLITDKVNIWPVIEENGAGFVETDNINGVTILIKKWLQLSPLEKRAMSQAAEKCYRKCFTSAIAREQLREVLIAAKNH